jgi:16S rRNA (cytosine1402-N4)-methyltransferase
VFDLGVSTMQLDEAVRGFSFREDAPLDMRMAGESADEPSAADLVNGLSERELADVIFHYGDERRSRRIAAAIVRKRPITTTDQLAGVVVGAVGRRPGAPTRAPHVPGTPHRGQPGTRGARRVFRTRRGSSFPGRVVVISYHSLEDGIVKRAFRDGPGFRALTKKPVVATDEEVDANPRARSAKLRAAERIERPREHRGPQAGGPGIIPIPRVRPRARPRRPPRATLPALIGGRAAAPRSPSGSWWPWSRAS